MSQTEQNKTEEPTPFKLKRSREKGTVARGVDLGFFSNLLGLVAFTLLAGEQAARTLESSMQRMLLSISDIGESPQRALRLAGRSLPPILQLVALFGLTLVLIVAAFEIIQLRGLIFSTQPLKPDFERLNPAKGFKRLFSIRMLKETLKNVVKIAIYSTLVYLVVRSAAENYGPSASDAGRLASSMDHAASQLIFVFALTALLFAGVDQAIARQEFRRQMRMSRSELTREIRDREGEPRIKRKRKQLHAEFAKQSKQLGGLGGSDLVIVNPQHYAVALGYDAGAMSAPQVTAKGRNHFALMLKRRAAQLSIAIFENPPLARALYERLDEGDEIEPRDYRAVADLYLKLAAKKPSRDV